MDFLLLIPSLILYLSKKNIRFEVKTKKPQKKILRFDVKTKKPQKENLRFEVKTKKTN